MVAAPQLMIFDMDGTLTKPAIDFDQVRAEIGIASGTILEALETLTPEQRSRAFDIIVEHERNAARDSELQEGVHQLMAFLSERRIPTAIATRNSRESVQTVLAKHQLHFDHAHTREDGQVKPSPQPILAICSELGVEPAHAWLVGDYLYDVQSGNTAGATTLLLVNTAAPPAYADQADHVIHSLMDILTILGNGRLQ